MAQNGYAVLDCGHCGYRALATIRAGANPPEAFSGTCPCCDDLARAYRYRKSLPRSPIEARLANALDGLGVPYHRQAVIGRYRNHRVKLTADFAVFAGDFGLLIECDGARWHRGHEERDATRDERLAEVGWETMHFTGRQLFRDALGCAAAVRDWAERREGQANFDVDLLV